MFFRMVYKSGQIFLPFCHNSRVWRTDGRTEISSQYRVCITCSAVKIVLIYMCLCAVSDTAISL